MKKRYAVGLATGLLVLGVAGGAGATLTTVGTASYGGTAYNLIYDNDLQLTWLDYTKSAATWQSQVNWAAGLNGAGVLSYNLNSGLTASWTGDWRLPSTVDGPYVYGYDGTTTVGYNITTSEMGHLYYTELGNKGYRDTNGNLQSGLGLANTDDFQNLVSSWYWSGTECANDPSNT